jgi:hypothetical protein
MEPSIEELKASAASRVDSLRSPSSTSFIQGSSSGMDLNLPNEFIKPGTKISGLRNVFETHNSSAFSTGNPPIHPQENLKTIAQTINGLIQKDKIQPDLGEFLNGKF